MSNALDVDDLVVHFGAQAAVDHLTLHVPYGHITALLGPNGAGKTTLVETALGFRSPTAGTVRVHGLDPVRDHAAVVARTGALLQRGGVWFPMTPRQVLALTATYYAQPRDPNELIDLLDLGHCATTPWRRLSGGEQQRTALALALLGRPKVLLLDEPTTAVDPEGRQVIRDLLLAERRRGVALLLTTHELAEAERVADDVVIMNHGRVLVQGTLDQLAGEPVIILETSEAIDVSAFATWLGVRAIADGERRVRCEGSVAPEKFDEIPRYLAAQGVSLTSLRTRASLEERYLDLLRASAVSA